MFPEVVLSTFSKEQYCSSNNFNMSVSISDWIAGKHVTFVCWICSKVKEIEISTIRRSANHQPKNQFLSLLETSCVYAPDSFLDVVFCEISSTSRDVSRETSDPSCCETSRRTSWNMFRKTSCFMINKHFSYFLLNRIFSIFFVDFSIHYVSISIQFFSFPKHVKGNSCETLRDQTL